MNAGTVARYLLGYLIGISVFALAAPFGIYRLAAFHPIPLPVGDAARLAVALILGCVGIIFGVWSNTALFFHGEGGPVDAFNMPISPRTKHLVVQGPYRYTRNPMVFGAFSVYIALAIYWNSLQAVVVLILCLIGATFYLKATEEKRLLKDFGEEFEEYRKRTPMIVPWRNA